MMSDEEIKEVFKLLGIKITKSKDMVTPKTKYLDKQPLDVTYQNNTNIDS